MTTTLFFFLISFFVVGAMLSLIWYQKKSISNIISNLFSIIGSLAGIILGGWILVTRETTSLTFVTGLPLLDISLRFDILAAYFMLIVGIVGLASSLFGMGYMRQYFKLYNTGLFGFFYNLFLLSLFLVITASNGLYFLIVWEIMSLASFFLVIFEHKHHETISAGILYFIMTHAGTMFLLAAFLLLYGATHTFDFSQIRLLAGTIPSWLKDTVFVLTLLGFGTKAGIIPLHIWLPKAHSAAPSHVSALMSGVMIKMGIFMLFRVFLDFFPNIPLWWGIVVLVIGACSSLLGVLYALAEHDLKRLLAYHSIENIGIILLGLGSSMIFFSLHQPALAAIAALAGLFHTLNHAVFKSLLFLGAGSVITQTSTRNLERYGGLIKVMPYTAFFFLIGAIAISGLPPLNGFASEWLIFQSLFAGIQDSSIGLRSLFLFAGGALALTGGLAAACFVKAFGITFLARPRSAESEKAKESSWLLVVPMGFLAVLCAAIGFGAGNVVSMLEKVVAQFKIFKPTEIIAQEGNTIIIGNGFAGLNMPMLLLTIIAIIALVYLFTSVISRKQKVVRDVTWDCGYTGLLPYMEITATAFSRSLVLVFKGLFQPTQQKKVEYIDAHIRYFTKTHMINFATKNVFEVYLYQPLHAVSIVVTKKVKQIQGGNLNAYILYIFLTLIGLFFWARYS